MFNLIIGIPLGVMASLGAWWILFHGIVPKIAFAEKVSRIGDSTPRYRLKIGNSGRRDVVDCEVLAEVRVRGADPNFPRNTWVFPVPVRTPRFPILKRKANRLIYFNRYLVDRETAASLPDDVASQLSEEGSTIEELFALGEKPRLRVIIFGYDSMSGSRKVFVSRDYTPPDIVAGKYEALSLAIAGLPPGDPVPTRPEVRADQIAGDD